MRQRERLRAAILDHMSASNMFATDLATVLADLAATVPDYRHLSYYLTDAIKMRRAIEREQERWDASPAHLLACRSCGDQFAATRRDARYCSPRCRQRARRSSVVTIPG